MVAKNVTSLDGTKVYADALGDPNNPSLVFVHGFSSSAAIFNVLFANAELSQRFHLVRGRPLVLSLMRANQEKIRYDMRGHGRSVKPDTEAGHASNLYAADFKAVIDHFKLHRPVVVGW